MLKEKKLDHDEQIYLRFCLLWFVMETGFEKADKDVEDVAILWLNSNFLGTMDTGEDDKEEFDERRSRYSMHALEDSSMDLANMTAALSGVWFNCYKMT